MDQARMPLEVMLLTEDGEQVQQFIRGDKKSETLFFPKTHLLKPQNDFFTTYGGQRVRRIKKKSATGAIFPQNSPFKVPE